MNSESAEAKRSEAAGETSPATVPDWNSNSDAAFVAAAKRAYDRNAEILRRLAR